MSGRSLPLEQTNSIGRSADQDASLSQSNSDGGKLVRDSDKEIDTDARKLPNDTRTSTGRGAGHSAFSEDVMAIALSVLRKRRVMASRPDNKVVNSELSSIFEDDLVGRGLRLLCPVGAIGKRHSRSKLIARKLLVPGKADIYFTRYTPSTTVSNSTALYGLPPQKPCKVYSEPSRLSLMDMYISRSKLKAFMRRRKTGKPFTRESTVTLSGSEDGDSSDCEDEETRPTNSNTYSRLGRNANGKTESTVEEIRKHSAHATVHTDAKSTESHDGDIKPPSSTDSPVSLPDAVPKHEREMLALFSMSELDLFQYKNVSQKRRAFALGSRPDPAPREQSQNTVPSATVGCVVHGLPRILNTS